MAGDFDLSARITGDATGLVSAAKQGVDGIEDLGTAQRGAAGAARELEQATESSGKAQADTARKTGEATRATAEGAQEQREAAKAARDAGTAQEGLGAAAARAGSQQEAAASSAASARSKLAAASTQLDLAETRAASAVAGLELAHRKAALAADDDADAQLRVIRDLANAEARVISTAQGVVIARERVNKSQRDGVSATDESIRATNRQGYAVRNVGQQFGDFGLQVAGGTSVARAFGQQAGQLGFALSELQSGPLVGLGKFLVGPWGIALTIGAAFLGPMIEKLFQAGSAAEENADKMAKAASAADSFGNAQSILGKVIDLTTGKIKTQNVVLIESIKLQTQANLLAAQAKIDALKPKPDLVIKTGGQGNGSLGGIGGFGNFDKSVAAAGLVDQQQAKLNAITQSLGRLVASGYADKDPAAYAAAVNKGITNAIAGIDRLATGSTFAGKKLTDVKSTLLGIGTLGTDKAAGLLSLKALTGGGVDPLLKPYKADPKAKKPPKPKSTEARDEFGRDAEDKIANLVGQFDEAPPVLDKTNKKIRELDDLIDDLGRKKPAGFADLIASAEAAKVTVRDGLIREVAKSFEQPKTLADKAAAAFGQLDAVIADLNKNKPTGFDGLIESAERTKGVIAAGLQKPYRDFIEDQRDGLTVQQLLTAGRIDEANALKTVQGLQKTMGPLTDAQKDSVLATVQAMRLEQRQLEIRNELQAKYLTAVGSIKGVVQDATQAFVRGDLGQLIKAPQKLLDSFLTLKGDKIFDNLFGGVFRDLTDQVNGVSPVKDAGKRMAAAVDEVADKSKIVATSFATIKPPVDAATKALGSFTDALNRAAGINTPANDNNSSSGLPGGTTIEPDGTIRVEANKVATPTPTPNPTVPGDKVDPFALGIDKVFGKLGIKDPQIFGRSIGQNAGKAFEGAATGAVVNGFLQPLGKALGFKTSKVGAQIGGAVGSFLPIPFGKEVGAVVGSVIGGLFKKDKFGSSTLSVNNGQAVAGTSIGSGKAAKEQADALGGSLADGLNSIVAALGAQLGSASVSIGYRPGHKAGAYRVDTSGAGKVTGVEAFDTEAEAVAFAIRDAILDGGVTGLSAAMQKALSSNADIDRAVQEALGVKALEASLGGVQGALKAQFSAEDAAGRERVRLAKAYGVDLVAVEKLNAEQRATLIESTLKSRLGSLSDTLNSLKFGDLFEGSAADKLKALQVQIDAAQKDAEAGKAGAADTLAGLLQQKVGTARDAYGTAGPEFTNARGDALSAIERVIKMETDRVNAAANGTGTDAAAMAAQTAVISEGVDVQVQTLAAVKDLAGAIRGTGSANDYSPNLNGIARKAAA